MITQIETTINNLDELKSSEKTREKIIHINERIIYYKELIIFYKKEIKNIRNVLKSKCNHILVNDSIEKVRDNICSNLNQTTHFKGYKKFKNNLYAFYELFENTEIEAKNNNFEKCLIYEILNTKKIKDTNISNNVVDFFIITLFSHIYMITKNN